jgi:hypothetical protein
MDDEIDGNHVTRQRVGEWSDWHDAYEDTSSELVGRMLGVRRHVAEIVAEAPAGAVTVLSICGGQGRELIGALEDHPRKSDVRGRLVELDADNTAFANRWATKAGLLGLEIVTGDASLGASYDGLAPVDLVVISGVFGHLSPSDRLRLIDFTRQLCHADTGIVWTSHLSNDGPAEWLRRAFLERRFEEFEHGLVPGDDFQFTVTRSAYRGAPQPFDPHEKIFTFGSSRAEREGTTSA